MSEDIGKLVFKLRSASEDDAYATPWSFGEVCREAAEAIAQLTRERDEAKSERNKWFNKCSDLDDALVGAEARCAALMQKEERDVEDYKRLSARCAALEEALKVAEAWMAETIEGAEAQGTTIDVLPRGYPKGLEIVRAALARTQIGG